MINQDAIISALSDLAAFLENANLIDRSLEARSDIELLYEQPSLAETALTGPKYWGGSGSFLDLIIPETDGAGEVRSANRTYSLLLLRLLIALRTAGMTRPDYEILHEYLSAASQC